MRKKNQQKSYTNTNTSNVCATRVQQQVQPFS